jgi:hypothetical protein
MEGWMLIAVKEEEIVMGEKLALSIVTGLM